MVLRIGNRPRPAIPRSRAASKKVLGHSFSELTQIAAKPLTGAGGEVILKHNNGMREAATIAGITRRRLPQAHEVSAHKGDAGAKAQAQALTV